MALGPCKHPPLPNKPGSNWVEKTGGLPKFIDCVARAIYHSGRSQGDVSKAIAIAVGRVEDWAAGKGGVKPDTRAQAVAAVAEWNAKRAASKAQTKNLSEEVKEVIDLAFDEAKHPRNPLGRWVSAPGGKIHTLEVGGHKLTAIRQNNAAGGPKWKVLHTNVRGEKRYVARGENLKEVQATAERHLAGVLPAKRREAAGLPKRVNSRAMTLSEDVRETVDLAIERLAE